jgi:precorrin-6B C5,15-methyltransferase / cobalt-precorrin-6B C5,C15-methyltransferase
LASAQKIHIVGIGDDGLEGLTQSSRQLLENAQCLVGAETLLAKLPSLSVERIVVGANLDEAVSRLAKLADKRVVVLASGDPLFYGIARYLCDKLGKERFDVVPHVSTMQMAFARVKESWEEAYLTNLANHPLDQVVDKIRIATKVGLFTSDDYPPAKVARALVDRKIDYFYAYVCENLGSPDECVTQGELAEIAADEFSPLNVMVLVRKPDMPDRPSDAVGRRLFGNPDDAFEQSKPQSGLLTPAEVRSLALAQMDLGPTSTVWDIGAGSGSVSIEAAQIASSGTVYAIEMDPVDFPLIAHNSVRFGVSNVIPVFGPAPEAWEKLPDPDAIFIGGSGRGIGLLVEQAYARLKPGGRLVAEVSSIESLSTVNDVLHRATDSMQVWMVNLARGTFQLERVRFEAMNPRFLFAAVKPK